MESGQQPSKEREDKDMMTITTTTIAIKFDFGWKIDTYTRWINGKLNTSNSKFIENFSKEYDGNGIEEIKVLEVGEPIYVSSFMEVESTIDDLRKKYDDINETILNY